MKKEQERTIPTIIFIQLYDTAKSLRPKTKLAIDGGKLPLPPIAKPSIKIPMTMQPVFGTSSSMIPIKYQNPKITDVILVPIF